MRHIIRSCMIGLFVGDNAVGSENAGTFLHVMRYELLLFGALNLMVLRLGLRALRHYR